jgi:DUF917 family protein
MAAMTEAQRRVLTLAIRIGEVAVSNRTDPERGVADARVVARLIDAGRLEKVDRNSHGQPTVRITPAGLEAMDGHR